MHLQSSYHVAPLGLVYSKEIWHANHCLETLASLKSTTHWHTGVISGAQKLASLFWIGLSTRKTNQCHRSLSVSTSAMPLSTVNSIVIMPMIWLFLLLQSHSTCLWSLSDLPSVLCWLEDKLSGLFLPVQILLHAPEMLLYSTSCQYSLLCDYCVLANWFWSMSQEPP